MKKTLLTSLACGALTTLLFGQAKVQIVHNSPDQNAAVVDVYVNDGASPAVDDLAYRSATGFVELPANTPIKIGIAPGTSSNPNQAVATINYTFEDGKTYYLIADGILGSSFNAYVFDNATESAKAGETDLTIYHGSLDAGTVDVQETSGDITLADAFEFGKFTQRYSLPSVDYYAEVRDDAQTATVAAFDVPLSGFDGSSLLAIASGYASGPNANFGLFAVPTTGGDFLPLAASTAQAQIIHNSPAAQGVDILINDQATPLVDVPFRTASGFVEVPVGLNQKLSVNLTGTTTEAIAGNADIKGGQKYTIIAAGDGDKQPLDLFINPMARMAAQTTGNTDVNVFHGATDAPGVDVTLTDGTVLVPNLAFGKFSKYLDLVTNDYVLEVRINSTNSVFKTYNVPLKELGLTDQSLTVVASGYAAPTGQQPAFGLFVALKDGGALIKLSESITTSLNELSASDVSIYPNPAQGVLFIDADVTNYQIINTLGETVQEGFSQEVDITNLPTGIYVINVQGEDFVTKSQIIKE